MKIVFLFIPSLVVLVACVMAGKHIAGNATTAPAAISFPSFDGALGKYSKATQAQKDDQFQRLKGTRVEWIGVVEDTDAKVLCVKENATTLTFDVRVTMKESERRRLVALQKGMIVTYRGTIDAYGVVMAHSLIDGEIVSYRQVEPVEMYKLLTDTENEVVDSARR